MLRDFSVRDILLIDRLDLTFQPGLNVLTGETGAGKSILLDCLGLALGWRGRADVVREGRSQGEVIAAFDTLPRQATHLFDDAGHEVSDELILRRVAGADGRKRAFVNDRRMAGDTLRALSDALVELHGQNDDRGLLNASGHRALLDTFGNHQNLLAKTSTSFKDWRKAEDARSSARETAEEAARDLDFLKHSVAELDALAPQPGEEDELDQRRRLMQAAEKIREDVVQAIRAVGPDGASAQAADAVRWLEAVADKAEGQLDDALAALSRALTELGEAEREIEGMLASLNADPAELERVEERLFAIRGLARKHRITPEELPGFWTKLAARLDAVALGDAGLEDLSKAVAAAKVTYEEAAAKLTAARMKAAARLDKAMAAELPPLKMERARFETRITEAGPGPEGSDTVSFQIATNPGAPAGPIGKIASGGELSRFLLALKVCLTASGEQTLIFDEIDRGVGGATADAVGRRLAALSENAQVIVVTHSPQVAARAAHHWRVEKSVLKGATFTRVRPLKDDERVDEIARMLAGREITDAARQAAEELLSA